jgi:hypothetical protein
MALQADGLSGFDLFAAIVVLFVAAIPVIYGAYRMLLWLINKFRER